MPAYRVINTVSGVDLGVYEGESVSDALEALARDAGYRDVVEMNEVTGSDNSDLVILEVVSLHGEYVYFDAAVALMDDDLRERLRNELAPCSDQEFLDAYVVAHAKVFPGEKFRID